jgi:phage gp46-like protein
MIKLICDLTTGQLSAKGKIELDPGLGTPIFLSLFGGNVKGITTKTRKPAGVENLDWFGNLYLQEENKPLFNSKFETYLKENPLTSGNLIKLKELALSDLDWIIQKKAVKSFEIVFEIKGANSVQIEITAIKPDKTKIEYSYLWSA